MKKFEIVVFTPGSALKFNAEDYTFKDGELSITHSGTDGKFKSIFRGFGFMATEQLDNLARPTLEIVK